MLLKIDDPKVAHEYWQAGLLVNPEGEPWKEYSGAFARLADDVASPSGETFLAHMHRAFISIED